MTARSPLTIDLVDREEALRQFLRTYPQWTLTQQVEALRATEYGRLDADGHVYLDYTGGGLYAESQLREHVAFMAGGIFGNPHSGNPASLDMTAHVEATRAAVLRYFNASPDEYEVVFTQNASGALKLVGESYPFRRRGRYVLSADNHNSVNGIREFANAKQASVFYAPLEPNELRLDDAALDLLLADAEVGDNLFAFPAQSNFTGLKHPLGLVAKAQALGWDVLLDCAAYAPTSRLDFSQVRPDYAVFSFYKMFGYPTGLGCLIAKHDKLNKLDRPWFGGGTIQLASVAARDHFLAPGAAGFEDGTVNYLAIPAIATGLRHLETIGIDTISERVACLTGWLIDTFTSLTHSNGSPLVKIHGPASTIDRGGTITSTLLDPDGVPYSGARIEELAGDANVSIRTGCFCNPGAGEAAHHLSEDFLLRWFRRPTDIGFQELARQVRALSGQEISAVRVSVGLATNFNDVYYAAKFLETLRDRRHADLGPAGCELHRRDTA